MIYFWIIVVLLFSALFSASEIAFVSANRLRIELEKSHDSWYSKIQARFFEDPGLFITTMLVGNNIALVIYGLLMAEVMEPVIYRFIPNDFIVVLIQTIISTILILIFAEFIPKAVSKLNPNSQIRTFALLLYFLCVILWPIAKFATSLSRVFFKIFRVSKEEEAEARFGKVDFNDYIESNSEPSDDHHNGNSEVKILQNALDFADVRARDCLVPRNELIACDDETSKAELIRLFDKSGCSKILIYKETIDDIIGYIHAIEMFTCGDQWQSSINTPIYVPETTSAEKVMKMLMQKKKSVAVVVDELGGTAGIVTLEDIVEEIFGDIEDEHDIKSVVTRKISDHEYLLSGRAEIDTINDDFGLELPLSDEYKTIAGLILYYHRSIPQRDEVIQLLPRFRVKVIRATQNKISLVKLFITPEEE